MKTLATLAFLMVLATTAYGQSLSRVGHVKWEVQGWSGDTVLLVGGDGETKTARVGDVIDGCLVSAEKVVCDPDEKRAIENESRSAKEKEAALKAATQAQLKKETDTRIAIEATVKELSSEAEESRKRLEVLKGEVAEKSSEAAEQQKQIAALKAQVDKLEQNNGESLAAASKSKQEEKLSNRELALKKEHDLQDFAWTEANVENIGNVMYADAGMVGIMKVDQTNEKKAEAVLKGAVRNKQVQGNYVYFTLSKDMLQIEEAR